MLISMMRERRPVVIGLGTNAWDGHWQTRQHVMAGLARRGWTVWYSNGPFTVWDPGRTRWRNASWRDRADRIDGVNVYWSGRWQLRWPRLGTWDRWVLKQHAAGLRRLAGIGDAPALVYAFHPQFWPLVQALAPRRLIYHCDDNFRLMGNWGPELAAMEHAMLERADLVLASSPRMAAGLPGDRDPLLLPNGADVEAFGRPAACPTELAAIPQPRIGYIGGLNEKVDFELVAEVADRRPDWHWVFIGQRVADANLSPGTRDGLARCESLPNVHLLGPRPYRELPAYVSHMDVNVLCYKAADGGWWTDVYPLKLHEYLASGQPVVGADIDVIRQFREVVAVADGIDEWLAALEQALAGGVGTPEARRRVAAANSWAGRLDQLEGWMAELFPAGPLTAR